MPAKQRKKNAERSKDSPDKSGTKNPEGSEQNASDNKCVHATQAAKPSFTYRRVVIRLIFVVGFMIAANLYSRKQPGDNMTPFITATEKANRRAMEVKCSKDYKDEKQLFPECIPKKCGRVVMDNVVSSEEARHLLKVAKAGFSLGGSDGGASILDLHSGALSKGSKFINVYKMMETSDAEIFTEDDFATYRKVKRKIHHAVASEFNINPSNLHLTKPTFFSRMTTKPAKTLHDEYWHVHVDKETYGSFHYTSLLYLADYGSDFTGGRFVFIDKNKKANYTVEPRAGRVSFFTSGSENPHYVEQVNSGVRYAITVSFTCDPKKAVTDPVLPSGGQ